MHTIGHIPTYLITFLTEMGFESVGSFNSLDNAALKEVNEKIQQEVRDFKSRKDSSASIEALKAELKKY